MMNPDRFDFSRLPVESAVRLLGRFGLELALPLLTGTPLPHPASLLSPSDIRWLVPVMAAESFQRYQATEKPVTKWVEFGAFIGRWIHSISQGVKHFLAPYLPFLVEIQPETVGFKDLTQGVLSENMPLHTFHRNVNRRIQLMMQGSGSPPVLSTQLWTLAGNIAWSDPKFRFLLARATWNHFRTCTLVTTPTSMPRFCAALFWLLFLVTATWPLPRSEHTSLSQLKSALQQLEKIAEIQVRNCGQTMGFWDQWLIWKLLSQCHWQQIIQLPRWMIASLVLLPFNQLAGIPKSVAMAHKKQDVSGKNNVELAAPDWEKQIPDWLMIDGRDSGRVLLRSL